MEVSTTSMEVMVAPMGAVESLNFRWDWNLPQILSVETSVEASSSVFPEAFTSTGFHDLPFGTSFFQLRPLTPKKLGTCTPSNGSYAEVIVGKAVSIALKPIVCLVSGAVGTVHVIRAWSTP